MKVLDQAMGDTYALYHGDSCEVLKGIPEGTIHYSITSIPFASLYTYSATDRDLGNSRDYSEFWTHYEFLLREWVRVMMPGRLISVHCMNLPLMKERDGVIGLRDFRGDVIRGMQAAGMIYHSEVCIWKDPLTEATRTKALGLMHKQIVKDSAMCRNGLPDYLVTFRKPGENPEPVSHPEGFAEFYGEDEPEAPKREPSLKDSKVHQNISMARKDPVYSHHVWRRYASPVWMDINQSETLQRDSAREEKDERHICPLQLGVIRRGVELWSNPGEVVLDPFDGIGSTGHAAIRMGRKHIGIELKRSYWDQSVANCKAAEIESKRTTLFDFLEST